MKDKTHVNVENARSEDQTQALRKIVESDKCPFCDPNYIKNEHKKPILLEGTHWFATENRWPNENAKHHYVFIHRQHRTSIAELSPAEWEELRTMTLEMRHKLNIPGGTFILRFGDSQFTGGTVTHLHAQLISGHGDKDRAALVRVG